MQIIQCKSKVSYFNAHSIHNTDYVFFLFLAAVHACALMQILNLTHSSTPKVSEESGKDVTGRGVARGGRNVLLPTAVPLLRAGISNTLCMRIMCLPLQFQTKR